MELTTQQNRVFEQIKAFIESDASIFILRGYAGTGKTTMVKVVGDYIAQSHHVDFMTPTGRAARVLKKQTGHDAVTIHRAIYEKACFVSKNVKDIAESEFRFIFMHLFSPRHNLNKFGFCARHNGNVPFLSSVFTIRPFFRTTFVPVIKKSQTGCLSIAFFVIFAYK